MQPTIYATATRLPWGCTEDVIPVSYIEDDDPSSLTAIDKKVKQDGWQDSRALDASFGQRCIRPASLSRGSAILVFTATFCRGWTYVLSVMSLFPFCLIFFGAKYSFIQTLSEMFPVIFVVIILPWLFSIYGFYRLKHKPLTKGQGAKWELNRHNGRVTIYKTEGEGENSQRVAYSRPFYEFDAYLTRNPGPNGIIYYNLRLQHRYEDIALKAFMDTSSGSMKPVLAAWDFIQNYMDTSKPLPDSGVLEIFRPYDPTSVEFDKQTKRNPRLRRDMDWEQWVEYKAKLIDNIDNINQNRPNLMANYVDYSQLN